MNRGADFVKPLVPSLRARTRYLTGHREHHNQATLACAAHGAGQHRDYVKKEKTVKLLTEIIEMLSTEVASLSGALLKTKVLLHKIGQKELVEWVNYELNGYPDVISLPPYRLLPAQVLVNAANMAYQITAHPIPLSHLDPQYRESLETAKMGQSLSVLEKFLEISDAYIMSDIPMEANGLLGKGLASGFRIQRAWCQISTESVAQIIVQVRSRLLDFVLELSEQLKDEFSEEEIRERSNTIDAANLFNNAIFGDNATILLGSGNRQIVTNTVIKDDFETLAKVLQQNKVSKPDIEELRTAIESDKGKEDPVKKSFGPGVKRWLQTMFSKAVETSWNIELGVASSLLAEALQRYYGWF